MNTKASLLLIWFLGFGTFQSPGQNQGFSYKRKIEGISDSWHKLVLENDIFINAANDLGDIRILGIKDEKDTLEAPYILKIVTGKYVKSEIPFKLINQTTHEKGNYYTFEVPGSEEINQIILDFEEQNFDWKVDLEGSQDINDWFTILQDYRILSIKNAVTDYTFTNLTFPAAKFKYFRLLIKEDEKPGLLKASLIKNESEPGKYRNYEIKSFEVSENEEHKQTILDVHLTEFVPVSMIIPDIEQDFDFYRPVKVQCLVDSVEGPDGWKYNYQEVFSGMLSSLEEPGIILNQPKASVFKIMIDNQNNTPLKVNSVVIRGNLYELTCRFSEPATYFLFYGNKGLAAPDYDIGYFSDKIPVDILPLKLGAAESIPLNQEATSQPLFTNKLWLWTLMILIIALLGWFSFKMIKK
ncbi:MAG: DUF3999 family protein [Cytophagales bacterium]|nr:DUF3999 family protein [Cytophagales bacterium]